MLLVIRAEVGCILASSRANSLLIDSGSARVRIGYFDLRIEWRSSPQAPCGAKHLASPARYASPPLCGNEVLKARGTVAPGTAPRQDREGILPHAPARKGPAKNATRKATAKTAVKKATRKAPAKKRTRNSLATATVAHQVADAKKAYDRTVVAEARAARNLRKEREDCAKGREAAAFNGHR
jgi:hypothetical protein